jgi:HEPN domain-containing protein
MSEVDISQVRAVADFALPVCLYIPDNEYSVQMPSYTAVVKITRRKQKHIDERLFIEAAESIELRRDRHGRLIYSELNVTIPASAVFGSSISVIDSHAFSRDDSLPRIALQMAMDVANRFIEAYRDVDDGAFYIKQISDGDIYKATVDWYLDGQHLGGDLVVKYGRGITLEPISLLPDALDRFVAELSTYSRMAVTKELLMSAEDYFDQGDYRMTVIEARTCVEVAVDQLLLKEFKKRDEDLSELRKMFGVSKKSAGTIEGIIEKATIKDKLTKGLKKAIDISLDDIEHNWQKWLTAKDSRERAVHKAEIITRAEAANALEIAKHIIELTK